MAKRKRNLKGDSIKLLAEHGWLAGDVEQWIPGTQVRRDLYGLFDILAVHARYGMLGLQVTDSTNLGKHVTAALKTKDELNHRLVTCLRAGMRVEYWGWRPKAIGTILTRTIELSECGEHVIAFDGSDVLTGEKFHGNYRKP